MVATDLPRPGLARVLTATLEGLDARRVRVEADVAAALPGFSLVGLPSAGLRESRERVGAALRNSGFRWPDGRITVSLAPADLRKDGAAMDLAVAVALLLASGQLRRPAADLLRRTLFIGELALDGALRPARGAVALAFDAPRLGVDRIVVPRAQEHEFCEAGPVRILPLDHLRALADCMARLDRARPRPARRTSTPAFDAEAAAEQLLAVRGQWRAKRALLVAAAGGHHLVLQGPPGCGKTMLARTLAALLPPLEGDAVRERRRILSCSGMAVDQDAVHRPPLRAPHHTVSTAGLVGGGRPLRPGEITLAHHGVLLLDELPEFGSDRLERLREPLTEGRIELARAGERIVLPARFQLVATANPCPCGWWGSALDRCRCPIHVVERHARRLSGPLRDRIDLWVELDREEASLYLDPAAVDDRQAWVQGVHRAAELRSVWSDRDEMVQAEAGRSTAEVDPEVRDFAQRLADRRGLSVRSLVAALRIARTLARLDPDADAAGTVRRAHLAEAFTYRPSSP